MVPALDSVPAKCIISSLIKDLLTLISIVKSLVKVNNGIIGKLVRLNKWVCNVFINNYKKLIRPLLMLLSHQ